MQIGKLEISFGSGPTKKQDAVEIIKALEEHPWEMIAIAGSLREKKFGNKVDPCSIINARSGNCQEDCAFCAQSAHHSTNATVYPLLDADTVVGSARRAFDHGVRRFCVVTSGRGIDTGRDLSIIAGCITRIRDLGMLPCATLGHLTRDQLQSLKDAGLYRYHHNVETSRRFFPNICTTHDYDERLATLADARAVGLSTCSCGIMGMGETMADRADMAFDLRDAGVDSLPVNFLMPIPGTPLEDANFMTPLEALKTIALFRFIMPETEIRVCGGRIGALRDLHPMIFAAGANGLMMGDYLTKAGRSFYDDERMLADLGLKLPGNKNI